MRLMLSFGVVLAVAASGANAQSYATSFETPTFTTGALEGQDSWTTTDTGTFTVGGVGALAHSGTQYVTANTGNINLVSASRWSWRPDTFVPDPSSFLLTASVFTGMRTNANANRTSYGGLDLYDGATTPARIGALRFSSDGNIQVLEGTSIVFDSGPGFATLNAYHKLEVRVNYFNSVVKYFFDNTQVYSSTTTSTTFGDADLYIVRAGTGTGGHQVVWDDLSISVLPAPGAGGLLGVAGLLAWRRRR